MRSADEELEQSLLTLANREEESEEGDSAKAPAQLRKRPAANFSSKGAKQAKSSTEENQEGEESLKMEAKNIGSRAYRSTLRMLKKQGVDEVIAKQKAKEASDAAKAAAFESKSFFFGLFSGLLLLREQLSGIWQLEQLLSQGDSLRAPSWLLQQSL